MTKTAPALVFSDLDGTLLDHVTYSYEPALPALQALRRAGIPLILASSKTSAEIAPLRAQLGYEHCEAIVENGGGLLEPHAGTPRASGTHPLLLSAIGRLPGKLRKCFSGFSDWTAEEVAERTGLDIESAARARQRDFSEPGIWSGSDSELGEFLDALSALGVSAIRGGRFMTLSFGGTKAERLVEIAGRYQTRDGHRPLLFALGDAPNDMEMLKAADKGMIIPNPDSTARPEICAESTGSIVRAALAGPAGWNESVLEFLAKHGLT